MSHSKLLPVQPAYDSKLEACKKKIAVCPKTGHFNITVVEFYTLQAHMSAEITHFIPSRKSLASKILYYL